MPEQLFVNTAAVQTMVSGWSELVGELNTIAAPARSGLSGQASAAAVNAAHAATAAFTQALAGQVWSRAAQVGEARTSFLANEAGSAVKLAGVTNA